MEVVTSPSKIMNYEVNELQEYRIEKKPKLQFSEGEEVWYTTDFNVEF